MYKIYGAWAILSFCVGFCGPWREVEQFHVPPLAVLISKKHAKMKSKKIDKKSFKVDYCQTLEQNKNQFFLKIPVENYEELNLLRFAIVNAIANTAELHEFSQQSNLPLTIRYLTHVLNQIDFITECQGLTKLFDSD